MFLLFSKESCCLRQVKFNEQLVLIQLTSRTNTYPIRIVEDVFVQNNGLVTPSDSYIIKIEDKGDLNLTSTLFGRPFLLTA
ncbi:hypothetical protein G4B88_028300, partial [Cannabis sativa]